MILINAVFDNSPKIVGYAEISNNFIETQLIIMIIDVDPCSIVARKVC